MTPAQEALCLQYEPFAGDRDVDVRLLSDRFLVSRAAHTCNVCLDSIAARTRVRARSEVFDEQLGTFYFCPTCCEAMAKSWDDDGHAIEAMYEVGYRRGIDNASGEEWAP